MQSDYNMCGYCGFTGSRSLVALHRRECPARPCSPLATEKPTNPKDLLGSDKLPLHLWPATATALGCVAMLNGARKYGRGNFRVVGVRASIYVAALLRHVHAWNEGEENDPHDDVPHLAAALACLAIIVDASAAGKLTDDRPVAGGYHQMVESLTPYVAALKERHKELAPRHYTIADDPQDPQVLP